MAASSYADLAARRRPLGVVEVVVRAVHVVLEDRGFVVGVQVAEMPVDRAIAATDEVRDRDVRDPVRRVLGIVRVVIGRIRLSRCERRDRPNLHPGRPLRLVHVGGEEQGATATAR